MKLSTLEQLQREQAHSDQQSGFIPQVRNRTLHADGDVLAYKACNLEEPFEENSTNLMEIITIWKNLAGAEFVELHLTMGHKGNREEIATVKEYQGHRKNTDSIKKQRVRELKEYMADLHTSHIHGMAWYEQEADDGMCQAMYNAIENNSDDVLFSTDKDLWMVPGKHINPNTYAIEEYPQGYGWTTFTPGRDAKRKIEGRGTSWFWHQLLMGDSADAIPGIDLVPKDMWLTFQPTGEWAATIKQIETGRHPKGKPITRTQMIDILERKKKLYEKYKDKPCGPAMAAKLLDGCVNDKQAYKRVLSVYEARYGKGEYTYFSWDGKLHHLIEGGKQMMLEQARLLWMRRTPKEDVKNWFLTLEN